MRDGDILQGRFRLDRQVGRGGFARVFLATDLTLERQVAIKLLSPELLARDDKDDFLARFRREARAVAALDHPNILGIFDYGEADGTIYLIMPYVDGGTVADQLDTARTIDLALVVAYLRQVAGALDYAHRRGIVHRDIKPQNMLLRREDDRLLLADFGIAKVLGDTGVQTRTGIVGTIAYMAPEQFRGQITPALDIYALGCVLFEMLTGRVPFPGATEQMVFGHISGTVPSLAALSGGRVPIALQAVVERALAKDPAARYPTAGDLAEAVARAIAADDAPKPVAPPTPDATATVIERSSGVQPAPHQTNTPASYTDAQPTVGHGQAPSPYHMPSPTTGSPPTGLPPVTPSQRYATGSDGGPQGSVPYSTPVPHQSSGPHSTPTPIQTPSAVPARSRLPLFAGLGVAALIVVALLGSLALARAGIGGSPGATAGSTLVAAGNTATATLAAPTATVANVAPTVTVGAPVAPSPSASPTIAPTLGPTVTAAAAAPTAAPATRAAPPRSPLAGQTAVTFTGHTDHLRGVAWTPDGQTLITGAGDGSVRFWRADGTPLRTISGRTFAVTSVAVSPNGALLAVGADGTSNQAQIWRIDGTPVATLAGHTDNVGMVAWSSDSQVVATASSDRTVRLWTAAGQPIRTLTGHGDIVQNVAWSPDGQRLVSASWDRTLRIWSRNGDLLATLNGHTKSVYGVAWSPDGSTIASGSEDMTVRLWTAAGQPIATLTGHTEPVSSVAWSPDGQVLASGAFDKTARLWSAGGQPLATLSGHTDYITSLAWTTDSRGLATGSWDLTIRLWR